MSTAADLEEEHPAAFSHGLDRSGVGPAARPSPEQGLGPTGAPAAWPPPGQRFQTAQTRPVFCTGKETPAWMLVEASGPDVQILVDSEASVRGLQMPHPWGSTPPQWHWLCQPPAVPDLGVRADCTSSQGASLTPGWLIHSPNCSVPCVAPHYNRMA